MIGKIKQSSSPSHDQTNVGCDLFLNDSLQVITRIYLHVVFQKTKCVILPAYVILYVFPLPPSSINIKEDGELLVSKIFEFIKLMLGYFTSVYEEYCLNKIRYKCCNVPFPR